MSFDNFSLRIQTFGGLSAVFSDGTLVRLRTNRAQALMLYLVAARGRFVHRESLVAALWPDVAEAAGRAQLRKTLWRIRSALAHSGASLVVAEDQVRLDDTGVEADLWRLSGAVADFDRADGSETSTRALMSALEALSGEFGAGIFDAWCVDLARAVAQDRLAGIERVVGSLQRAERFLQAVHWANRGLSLDPLAEQLHRALIECHVSMGDLASALRQCQFCADSMAEHLGIAPSPETKAVWDAVIAAGGPFPAPKAEAVRTVKRAKSLARAKMPGGQRAIEKVHESRVTS